MKQTKERTKWTAVALDPPPWHTAFPWQQPHALPQPSPCQRRGYSHTAGMSGDCRHLMCPHALAKTHTQTHSNTLTRAHKPKGKTHTVWFYSLAGTKHVTHLLISQIEAAGVCVCVCHSSLFVSGSPSPQALTDAPACRVCAYEQQRTHTLCTSRTAMSVSGGHKGGIRKKKVKNMSVNSLKQHLHTLSFSQREDKDWEGAQGWWEGASFICSALLRTDRKKKGEESCREKERIRGGEWQSWATWPPERQHETRHNLSPAAPTATYSEE